MIIGIEEITDILISDTIENIRIVGKDQYSDKDLEYPECYAKFIMSLYYKYKNTNEDWYKNQAKKYIEYLLELGHQTDDELWWGLPYNWGDTKTHDGFLITTAFCLKALYTWYEEGIYTDVNIINKAIKWCTSLHNEEDGENGFWYSKKLNKNIYNATSVAVGVLANAKEFLSLEQVRKIHKSVDTLIVIQKRGYWNYSNDKVDVDLLHQCYTCEGIFEYATVFEDQKAVKTALEGVDFIIKNMKINKMERYLFKMSDPEKLTIRIKYLLLRVYSILNGDNFRFSKPRAWSYGAFIRVLIYSYRFSGEAKYLRVLEDVVYYLKLNIINKRMILFSEDSSESYVRNTFHILESLCLYEAFINSGENYD